MGISHMNKKGFLLIDSLLTVFIVSSICLLCFSIYKLIGKYEEGYMNYQSISNDEYENIFNNLPICEVCIVDESD